MGKEEKNPFKIGDCVYLKGSKHKMEVERILGEGNVMCIWKDEDKNLLVDTFKFWNLIHCAKNITSKDGSLPN